MSQILLYANALNKQNEPCCSNKFPESNVVDFNLDALNGDCHVCWFNH